MRTSSTTVSADHSGPSARLIAATLAALYLALAVAWILVSDSVVADISPGDALARQLQSIKGLTFVAASAALMYLAVLVPLLRLQRLERGWRHLMASLDDGVWLSSPDGRKLVHVNPALEQLYGRTRAEFEAHPHLWRQAVHADDRPRVQAASTALAVGQSRDITYRIERPDGTQRWVRDRASVVRDHNGQAMGLAGVVEDITQAREIQVRERMQRDRLEGIVESAMDAIITIDSKQTVCVFNWAASAIFGVPVDQALGSPLSRFIPERHREGHHDLVETFRRSGDIRRRMTGRSQLTGLRADGQEFPLEASISRCGEDDGVLMTVVLRDITERLRAEAALIENVEARAANRHKTEFLSRMSHELRTPLNAVLGFAQLMQTDTAEPLSHLQQQRIEHVRVAGWHLLALINDVLDLSRVESGQLAIESQVVDLQRTVDDALLVCEGLARRVGVTVSGHGFDGPCAQVSGDVTRLRQVIINLLSNAIKYNRHPGGTVQIHAYCQDSEWVLDIQDSGIGMTAEQLAHLYEPFNRLGREVEGIEGTGIGLVLARQLVAGMKGRLEISSEAGTGTLARLSLPAALDELSAPSALEIASACTPLTPGDDGPQGIVLYIEDNPVNALVVEQLLLRWRGVRCVHAATGQDGLDLAHLLQPDLVLLDMRLPDIDGTAVLHALRADPATRDLTVVALSASAMPDERERATAAGAQAFWTKPLDFAQFEVDVARILAA